MGTVIAMPLAGVLAEHVRRVITAAVSVEIVRAVQLAVDILRVRGVGAAVVPGLVVGGGGQPGPGPQHHRPGAAVPPHHRQYRLQTCSH